jgi:hypothetical protein
MHHIIEQVDAYLAVLHQAREILLNDGERMPVSKIKGRNNGVWTKSQKLQNSSGQPADNIHGAPRRSGAGRKSSKKGFVSATRPKTSSPILSHFEPAATMS